MHGKRSLNRAARTGNRDLITFLLSNGLSDEGPRIAMNACKDLSLATLTAALDSGVDSNVIFGDEVMLKVLLRRQENTRSRDLLQVLLDNDVNPLLKGVNDAECPLFYANKSVLKYILPTCEKLPEHIFIKVCQTLLADGIPNAVDAVLLKNLIDSHEEYAHSLLCCMPTTWILKNVYTSEMRCDEIAIQCCVSDSSVRFLSSADPLIFNTVKTFLFYCQTHTVAALTIQKHITPDILNETMWNLAKQLDNPTALETFKNLFKDYDPLYTYNNQNMLMTASEYATVRFLTSEMVSIMDTDECREMKDTFGKTLAHYFAHDPLPLIQFDIREYSLSQLQSVDDRGLTPFDHAVSGRDISSCSRFWPYSRNLTQKDMLCSLFKTQVVNENDDSDDVDEWATINVEDTEGHWTLEFPDGTRTQLPLLQQRLLLNLIRK